MASLYPTAPAVKPGRVHTYPNSVRPDPATQTTFVMVPSGIAEYPDLYPGAKLLCGAICSLSKSQLGRCIAGNECLARMTGLSVVQVRRLLATLEGRGLIAGVMDNHERVEIRVEWSPEGGI